MMAEISPHWTLPMISQNWFGSVRQQAIIRVNVDRFMSPYCAMMCWVTVIISMMIPASPSHLWGEPPVIDGSHKTQWCGAFVFALLLVWIICWTNRRVAHGWRRHDANVISLYWLLVIFKMLLGPNVFILQNILKMLIARQRKLHWLSWISILPFKDGKLLMITLSSAMPGDNQSTGSTRPSTSLMSTM